MTDPTDPAKALREWCALDREHRDWIARELIEVGALSMPAGSNRRATEAVRALLSSAQALLARLEAAEGLLEDAEELLCTAVSYLDAPGLEGDIREWRDRLAPTGTGKGGKRGRGEGRGHADV